MIETRLRLIPECHADTALITFLAPPNIPIDHAWSVPEVEKEMKRAKQNPKTSNVILVGIIDNDKKRGNELAYFENFSEYDRGERVSFRQNETDFGVQHFLIVLEKAIETFLMYNADSVGIKLSEFGFSENLKEFCNELKTSRIESNDNFQKLLAEMQRQKAPDFIKIQHFISELLDA